MSANWSSEVSYYAAKRHLHDVHTLKLRNVVLCCKTTSEPCPQIEAQKCRILLACKKLKAARVATEMSYYAAKRHPTDVHKLKLRNVIFCFKTTSPRCPQIEAQKCLIMLACKKLKAARVATEMSFYASKWHPTDVFSKLKAARVATEMSRLCWRLAHWKLQGLQQKCRVCACV